MSLPSSNRQHPSSRLHRAGLALAALLAVALAPPAPSAALRLAQPPAPTAQPEPGNERASVAYLPMVHDAWSTEPTSIGDPDAPGLGNPGYNVSKYEIQLVFDIDATVPRADYTAVVTVTGHSFSIDAERIALDFVVPPGGVDVHMNGAPARWWAGSGNKIWVAVPSPRDMTTSDFSLRFAYSGSAGEAGSGLIIRRSGADAVQVWSPIGSGSGWFPGNHHPRDRADFAFTITTPDPYLGVANGGSAERTRSGTSITTQSVAAMATNDAMVNVGRYTVVQGTSATGNELVSYLLRSPAEAQPMIQTLTRQLDYFSQHLDLLLHGSLTIVESGAANSASVTGLYAVGRNQAGQRPAYFDRNAALMARQWFGGEVGAPSRADDWLNSGLATYLGALYLARDQGPEIVRARMAAFEWGYAFGVAWDAELSGLPADGSPNTAALVANKAPWAFHRLRQALGDEAFWTALTKYRWLAHEGSEVGWGMAAVDALEEAATQAAGGQTDEVASVFAHAFLRDTTPRLNLAWSQAANTVRIRVCQLTLVPNVFPLPLGLHGNAGAVGQHLDVSRLDESFEIAYAGRLTAITPDPDQTMLADVIVHPMGDAPLPECGALPRPALPNTAAAAADATSDGDGIAHKGDSILDRADVEPTDGRAGSAGDGDVGFAWAGEDEGDGSAIERAHRAAHAAAHLPAHLRARLAAVPGEPSIGDPYIPYLGNTGYDVVTYTVKARIDPPARRIEADTLIEARGVIGGLHRLSLDFMRMDGDEGLAVSAVEVDGLPAAYERPADADKLWIDLPAPLADGQAFAIRVVYAGRPRPGGTDIFSGGLLPHGQQTMYAISEPDGTRNWIPSNDHPRDKAYFNFVLTAPMPFVIAANGVPGTVTRTETDSTAVFAMRQPMSTYLATAAVGRYRTADQDGPNGVAIRHFFLGDPAVGMRVVDVTPDILDVFGWQVAPYPFDTYGHFAAPDFGGGMENQTMTAIGANVFGTRTPRSAHSLIAHEAAHQWFGDALSPHGWVDIWLNEGFATYFAELWRASRVGPEPLGWRMEALRYTVLASGRSAPVSMPALADMFGTNTYEKGGWVLHMLRRQVGDAAFFGGITDYFNRHLYGNVRTDDLRAALEAASGTDLAPSFEQWVHRPGNPVVHAGWHQDGDVLSVRFCPSSDGWNLPVAFAAHGTANEGPSRQTRGTANVEPGAPIDVASPVDFTVTGVTLDPDFALLADLRVIRAESPTPACEALATAWDRGTWDDPFTARLGALAR